MREMRLAAGLSQRALASSAATSQPAVVRYEGEGSTPSWETLQRLAAACGRRLTINAEPVPDPDDIELVGVLLDLSPEQRMRALRRYARLRGLAEGGA